jgi:DNA replication protein DnaC
MKNDIAERLSKIGLRGVANTIGNFSENIPLLEQIISCEEQDQLERSNARRLAQSKIETFRPMSTFDWKWPKKIPRGLVENALDLAFLKDKGSIIIIGPSGSGKTMIAKNIGMNAVMLGKKVLFVNAGAMLNNLSCAESHRNLEKKLAYLSRFELVILDELGYLSYADRHADLLFQFIERRHEKKSIIITTNKGFNEWNTIFPSAACVSAIIDRLVQYADIIDIEADSFRLHQGLERQKTKQLDLAKRKQDSKIQ